MNLRLRNGSCHAGSSELRVGTPGAKLYTYPDVVVICGEPQLADDRQDTLLNPALIAEVLSASTEAKDRGLKFHQYRRIESLTQYVLVSQVEPLVEVFSRDAGKYWSLREYSGLDSVCRLTALDLEIPLSEIYRGVPLALNT